MRNRPLEYLVDRKIRELNQMQLQHCILIDALHDLRTQLEYSSDLRNLRTIRRAFNVIKKECDSGRFDFFSDVSGNELARFRSFYKDGQFE